MVERKPRVAITLSDETREVMQRLAELEGTTMTRIVAGIVESFTPTALQLVEAMEVARDLPEEKRAKLAAAVEEVEAEVLSKTNDAQAAFSNALGLAQAVAK